MQPFDILIKNGTILTMDSRDLIVEKGVIGLQGDRIAYLGNENSHFQAQKTIDAGAGLILPGLVNGHTHAAMSLFRGLADDLPLMEWLNNYIFPVESRMGAPFVHTGALLACAEMIMSGTTTFCDMYIFEEEVAGAAKKAGMRALVGEVLYDFDSPNYGPPDKGLKYTESLIKRWEKDPLISIAVEPHALFTCSPDLLSGANELSKRYQVPLILHLAETLNELDAVSYTHLTLPTTPYV